MKAFLSSLSIWVGAIVAALSIVDWVLTEKQKKRLNGWAESTWLWLEYHQVGWLLAYIKSYKVQLATSLSMFFISVGFTLLLFLYFVYLSISSYGLFSIETLVAASLLLVTAIPMILASWKIYPKLLKWILNTDSVLILFIRALSAFLACFGCSILAGLLPEPAIPEVWQSILELLFTFLLGFIIWTGMLVGMLIFVSLFWLILIQFLRATWGIAQFIIIRIAENPKGPVLGISGLLVGIGALAKAFL